MLKLVVDVHGVVANFFQAFCEYHEIPQVYDNWPKGKYDIHEVTGIAWDRFPIGYLADLPEMDDLAEIMGAMRDHQIVFASRAYNQDMAMAIQKWVHSRFAPANMFACQTLKAEAFPEEMCQEAILIDDCEAEVEAWRAKGGKAILLPRPWNSAEGDPVEVLEDQILFMSCDDDESYLEPDFRDPDLGEPWNED